MLLLLQRRGGQPAVGPWPPQPRRLHERARLDEGRRLARPLPLPDGEDPGEEHHGDGEQLQAPADGLRARRVHVVLELVLLEVDPRQEGDDAHDDGGDEDPADVPGVWKKTVRQQIIERSISIRL